MKPAEKENAKKGCAEKEYTEKECADKECTGREGHSKTKYPIRQDNDKDECPICYQNYSYKTKLPGCGHMFCFLCIKGVALKNCVCPLCRKRIPRSIFRDPVISNNDQSASLHVDADDGVKEEEATTSDRDLPPFHSTAQWFYEARHGGWWRYERRHEDDLEIAYRDGRESVDMLLAGNIYVIDFENMCQYRKDAGRNGRYTRAVKRVEKPDPALQSAIRGIAGLRTPDSEQNEGP